MCGKIEELITEVRASNSVNKEVIQDNSELHRKVRNLEKEKNSYERKLAMVSRSLITTPPCDAVQAATVRPRDRSQVLEVARGLLVLQDALRSKYCSTLAMYC